MFSRKVVKTRFLFSIRMTNAFWSNCESSLKISFTILRISGVTPKLIFTVGDHPIEFPLRLHQVRDVVVVAVLAHVGFAERLVEGHRRRLVNERLAQAPEKAVDEIIKLIS